jgi:hypothetical protein
MGGRSSGARDHRAPVRAGSPQSSHPPRIRNAFREDWDPRAHRPGADRNLARQSIRPGGPLACVRERPRSAHWHEAALTRTHSGAGSARSAAPDPSARHFEAGVAGSPHPYTPPSSLVPLGSVVTTPLRVAPSTAPCPLRPGRRALRSDRRTRAGSIDSLFMKRTR